MDPTKRSARPATSASVVTRTTLFTNGSTVHLVMTQPTTGLRTPQRPLIYNLPPQAHSHAPRRKKMYEIHMARTEALANAAAAAAAAAASAAASAPSPSVLGLAVKRELVPRWWWEFQSEGDGPIDLSKRPRLGEASGTAVVGWHPAGTASVRLPQVHRLQHQLQQH
ncbi:hypothetical protein FQA47_013634 [Oryzias melastigma]|uniref:Uncharacterized protein n=1 Tax=Oryzias melastigma TaxID=30732 RepID=A0A834F2I2_ORYME|nr:hypothetical protein FQA47_013634 [Oryzias melastigma]